MINTSGQIPIVIVYHCYLFGGAPPELMPNCCAVVYDQMKRLRESGLGDAASEMICGINGGNESRYVAAAMMPPNCKIVMHGLESRCENPTIVLLENWLKSTTSEAHILYFHAKSSSHDPATEYGRFDWRWKECMMRHCIDNWRQCVADLLRFQAVGCHWMTGQGHDHSQNYFAGTFWWARASFLRTLPSILARERIKTSGLASLESRYESEVWIGNGPLLPVVKDYADHGIGACP